MMVPYQDDSIVGGGGGVWFNSLATASVVDPQPATIPVADNADTLYGTSMVNYGLGPNFSSQRRMAGAQLAASAAPSILWLVALLVVVAVFS